jgi:ribonuclease T1
MKHLLRTIQKLGVFLVFTFFCTALLVDVAAEARGKFAYAGVHETGAGIGNISVAELPKEAQVVLLQIKNGGPFSYDKDGVVFGNYEKILPPQKRGYYHEYTVATPSARSRGARRLITGGSPVSTDEIYYTDDHYQTFKKIKK